MENTPLTVPRENLEQLLETLKELDRHIEVLYQSHKMISSDAKDLRAAVVDRIIQLAAVAVPRPHRMDSSEPYRASLLNAMASSKPPDWMIDRQTRKELDAMNSPTDTRANDHAAEPEKAQEEMV